MRLSGEALNYLAKCILGLEKLVDDTGFGEEVQMMMDDIVITSTETGDPVGKLVHADWGYWVYESTEETNGEETE